MTFIVTLIALLIERFFDWSHLRRWVWYANFQRAVTERLEEKSPYLILGLTVIPLLIGVLCIQFILQNALFGFVELLFQLFVLLYCLGPQNLWADTFACINALMQEDAETAEKKLQASFGKSTIETSQSLHGQLLNHIFIAANRRIFAIVFWFIILGPIGAVLYRAMTLSSATYPNQKAVPELISSARVIESALDWIPVRIFTCILALGGHCVKVLTCWRKSAPFGLHLNDSMLMECGTAALGADDISHIAEDGSAEKNALGLLDRALVITIVGVAIIMLMI